MSFNNGQDQFRMYTGIEKPGNKNQNFISDRKQERGGCLEPL